MRDEDKTTSGGLLVITVLVYLFVFIPIIFLVLKWGVW